MACKNCNKIIKFGVTCTVCENFKMCIPCYEKVGHSHQMRREHVAVLLDIAPLSEQNLLNALQSGDFSVRQYLYMLSLAYQQQEGGDGTFGSLLKHIKSTGYKCSCQFCKQMILLYRHHSIKCPEHNSCSADCELLKKHLAEENTQTIEQKLLQCLKNRFPVSTANTAASTTNREASDSTIANLMLARKFTIQRCVRTLVHACHCLESDCMPLSCQKMKRILSHIKVCKRKLTGGCTICRQLGTLCCYHAKTCKEAKCSVLLCSSIKRKMQQMKIVCKV